MEKRIGTILILVKDKTVAHKVNQILSSHDDIILGRLGLPRHPDQKGIISLLVEGTTDRIGSMTGQLGRIHEVQVKSAVLSKDE